MEIEFLDIDEFRKWARRIGIPELANIERRLALLRQQGLALGMPNIRRLDDVIWELRSGKYRLYFSVEIGVAMFLAYGEKDTQQRDIRRAQERAR